MSVYDTRGRPTSHGPVGGLVPPNPTVAEVAESADGSSSARAVTEELPGKEMHEAAVGSWRRTKDEKEEGDGSDYDVNYVEDEHLGGRTPERRAWSRKEDDAIVRNVRLTFTYMCCTEVGVVLQQLLCAVP